jgi:hypothetical protein
MIEKLRRGGGSIKSRSMKPRVPRSAFGKTGDDPDHLDDHPDQRLPCDAGKK